MSRALTALALVLATSASLAASAVAGGPLRTAVVEPWDWTLPTAPLIFSRIHGAGASMSRVSLSWYSIAPKELPAQFDPTNPFDPAYDWSRIDSNIQAAFAQGIEPYLIVDDAPVWARLDDKEGGAPPNAADLGAFMRAAAARYSGSTPGLPRIRYWQIWIEPNVNKFFRHQYENGKLLAPKRYAAMVNAVADAVHSVRPDNKVIAGGLSPFTVTRGDTQTITPMAFMAGHAVHEGKRQAESSCPRRRATSTSGRTTRSRAEARAPRLPQGRHLAR